MNLWHILKTGGLTLAYFCTLVSIDLRLGPPTVAWQTWAFVAIPVAWVVAWGLNRRCWRGSKKETTFASAPGAGQIDPSVTCLLLGGWPVALALIPMICVSHGLETVCRDVLALTENAKPNDHAKSNLAGLVILFFAVVPLLFHRFPPDMSAAKGDASKRA